MVGVIFHERCAAFETSAHHLHRTQQRRRLPVAFRAETVAIRHQTLGGDAGELLHAVQDFEGVGETFEVTFFKESTDAKLDARGIQKGLTLCAARLQWTCYRVKGFVLGDELFDRRIADRINFLGQIADPVPVDRVAKLHLRRNFVALGDSDFTHIVGEASEFCTLCIVPSGGDPHPDSDAFEHVFVFPMTDDDLTVQAHTGTDETELASAMSGLVEIHEIHVDGRPRDFGVKLGMKL